MSKIKTEYYETSLCVRGTKKRARTPKFHLFKLANVTLETRDSEEAKNKIIEAARLRLSQEMKDFSEAWLSFTYGYEEEGSPFRMSEPFHASNFKLPL